MQIKISKTLEAIIARAAFNTTKAGLDHSLKDFLTLEPVSYTHLRAHET